MNVIQEITSQTSAGTGETAESIGNLANMAFDLRESVAGFTLPAEMIADLEEQEMATATVSPTTAIPPTLDDSIDLGPSPHESDMEGMLADLDVSEEDMDQAGDFFELLAGGDDEDLLSDFDVDLSDIETSDDDKKNKKTAG